MKRFLSMRLLGVMAIAAIALSNVILSACSEDDDLEMNSSTLAKGLMTRSGENNNPNSSENNDNPYPESEWTKVLYWEKDAQYYCTFNNPNGNSWEHHMIFKVKVYKYYRIGDNSGKYQVHGEVADVVGASSVSLKVESASSSFANISAAMLDPTTINDVDQRVLYCHFSVSKN